ncbi:DUF3352 domain-containing protein [Parabacteroides sp. OttesenSCG-928-G06]|nr:DUF3352 domain-containing protein [Parabacteroides sp. OttesenSCG-928-K15]MDL2282490.1 DUF3352 domain-containing protein [Parabacteroides sp. OttesenSCG-928-G06]
MDEHDNKAEERILISTRRVDRKRIVRRVVLITGILLFVYLLYSFLAIYISPDRRIQQIYLVPHDAAFIIQSSNPVDDWRQFSHSETWKSLKNAKSIETLTAKVEKLDSILMNNKNLLSLVGKRDMLISLHQTRANDWDYLVILDMQKVSKMERLKDQIEIVLRMADYAVTHRMYNDINIIEMRDQETRDILYAAFVDNHYVTSYTSKLVEAAIDARKNPKIGLEYGYMQAEKMVAGKGLYRVFVNYAVVPKFLSVYLQGGNKYIDMFCASMDFAGFYFHTDQSKIELKGHTLRGGQTDPYVAALLNSGRRKKYAHTILSARTALYGYIGLENMPVFVQELENAMSVNDKILYTTYMDSRKKIENYFDISLEEHFLSWMSGEFALAQSEPGLLGREPEHILVVGAKDIKDARKKMEYMEKRIKNRTPIHVKTVDYKGFEVNYIEMKGFFRLFFGNIFDRFEKPYYTYIGDYVVFSNQASSLLSFIEDYEQKNLLADNPGFQQVYSYYPAQASLFLYLDMHKFYPQLQPMLKATAWSELETNRQVLYSFPYISLQVSSGGDAATMQYVMDYKPYDNSRPVSFSDGDDREMDENAETEKELMNELKRFYVEKFEGNVLREFYPEGALKSETEVKEGKRHGRHREYYESGQLRLRGKYVNNRMRGTWKYYTPEGKFERKEKF